MASSTGAQAGQFDDFFKAMAKRKLSVTDILKYSTANNAPAEAETSSTRVVLDEQQGRAKKRRKRRQVQGGSNDDSAVASRTGSQSAASPMPESTGAAVTPWPAQASPASSARPAVSVAAKAAVKAERKRIKAVERARLRALERLKEQQQQTDGTPRQLQAHERQDSDTERAQRLKQAKEAEKAAERERQERKAERTKAQQQQKEEAARLEQERQELARAQELKQAEDAAAAQEQEKRERKERKAQRREARAQRKAEKVARKERKEVERLQQEAQAREERERAEEERREREEEEERQLESERLRLQAEEEARERRAAQERAFEEAKEKERAHFAEKARLKLEASRKREDTKREEAKRKEAQREARKCEKAERARALEERRIADEAARKAEETAKEAKTLARADRRKKRESTGTSSAAKAKPMRAPSTAASDASDGEGSEGFEPDETHRATRGLTQSAHAENRNAADPGGSLLADSDWEERIHLIDEDKDFFMLDLPLPDWGEGTYICQLPPMRDPTRTQDESSAGVPKGARVPLEASHLAHGGTPSAKQPALQQAQAPMIPSTKPHAKTIEVVVPVSVSASSRKEAVNRIPPSQGDQNEVKSTVQSLPASAADQMARPLSQATPLAHDDASDIAATHTPTTVTTPVPDLMAITQVPEDTPAQDAHAAEDTPAQEGAVQSEVLPDVGQSGSADLAFDCLAQAAPRSTSSLTQQMTGEEIDVQLPEAGKASKPNAVGLSDVPAERAGAEGVDLDEVDELEDEDETEQSAPAESESAAVAVRASAPSDGGASTSGQPVADGPDGEGVATSPFPGPASSPTDNTQPASAGDAMASTASSPASSESVDEPGTDQAADRPSAAAVQTAKTSAGTEVQLSVLATDADDTHASAREREDPSPASTTDASEPVQTSMAPPSLDQIVRADKPNVVVDTPTDSTFDMDVDANIPAAPDHSPSPRASPLSPAQATAPVPSSPTSSQRLKPSVSQLLDSLEDESSASSSDSEEEDDGYLEDQPQPNISISQRRRYAASSSPELDGASDAGSIQHEVNPPQGYGPASTGMFAPTLHDTQSAAGEEERDASPPAVTSPAPVSPAEVRQSSVSSPQQVEPKAQAANDREQDATSPATSALESAPHRGSALETDDAVHARRSPATSSQRSESPQMAAVLRSPAAAFEETSLPVSIPPTSAAGVETSNGAVNNPPKASIASILDGNTGQPYTEEQQLPAEREMPSSEAHLGSAIAQSAPVAASDNVESVPEQMDLGSGDSAIDEEKTAVPLHTLSETQSPESPIHLPTPSKPVSHASGSSMLESIRQRRKSLSLQDESASQMSQDLLNDMRGSPGSANGTLSLSPSETTQVCPIRAGPAFCPAARAELYRCRTSRRPSSGSSHLPHTRLHSTALCLLLLLLVAHRGWPQHHLGSIQA